MSPSYLPQTVWGVGAGQEGEPYPRNLLAADRVLVKLVAHTHDEGTHPRITVLSCGRD